MKDPVVQDGDPVLREKAAPVETKDIGSKKINDLLKKMQTVLSKEEFGVAIAAPQIGASLRIFVIAEKAFRDEEDDTDTDEDNDSEELEEKPLHTIFINPQIIRLSRKKKEMSEGCLSVRGVYGSVVRHEKASIKALDEHGKPFTYHGSGLIAHIFQHEVDHLEGILFTDKAVSLEEEKAVEHE